jgi:hypothetical protein
MIDYDKLNWHQKFIADKIDSARRGEKPILLSRRGQSYKDMRRVKELIERLNHD